MRGLLLVACAAAFQAPATRQPSALVRRATCTPAEANKVVNLAKQAIGRDAGVKDALGALQRVENIIGSGSPAPRPERWPCRSRPAFDARATPSNWRSAKKRVLRKLRIGARTCPRSRRAPTAASSCLVPYRWTVDGVGRLTSDVRTFLKGGFTHSRRGAAQEIPSRGATPRARAGNPARERESHLLSPPPGSTDPERFATV